MFGFNLRVCGGNVRANEMNLINGDFYEQSNP
jgi:hypothetical protein